MKLVLLLPGVYKNCPKMGQLQSIDFLEAFGPMTRQALYTVSSQETGVLGFKNFKLELINSNFKWFVPPGRLMK